MVCLGPISKARATASRQTIHLPAKLFIGRSRAVPETQNAVCQERFIQSNARLCR